MTNSEKYFYEKIVICEKRPYMDDFKEWCKSNKDTLKNRAIVDCFQQWLDLESE